MKVSLHLLWSRAKTVYNKPQNNSESSTGFDLLISLLPAIRCFSNCIKRCCEQVMQRNRPRKEKNTITKNTSVNSIISMPSVVYQWRKARLLNMAENWSVNLLNASCIAVLLYRKVADVFCPIGGTLHTAVFMLFGIHSTNEDEYAFCISEMVSSTSLIASWPLNIAAAVRYLPWRGSHATIMFWGPNILLVSSEMP